MRSNGMGDGSGGHSGRVRAARRRGAIGIVAACGLLGSMAGADAAETLRWRFREGETLRFAVEQKSSMTVRAMGTERRSNRTQTTEVSWKILRVSPDGEAEVTHRVERIRMHAEMPPLMPFDFDSAASKGDPPGFEAEARQLRSQVGAEFSFKMKPTGEITDIKLSEQTLKGLRAALPPGQPEAEIPEQAIKESLLQESPPSFPSDAPESGKSWSARPARMPLGFATLVVDRTFAYRGPDPGNPALRLIEITTNARLEPMEGTDVKATIRSQDGQGSMTFDAQAGRVVRTRFAQKMELAIAAMGQSIEQSSQTETSMSLLP